MIGQTLSHYKILEKLGSGGMGEVYRALDTRLDRTVAIKVIRPEAVGREERKQRFVREAKAASALNHPNIITIYEIDQAPAERGSLDFIVMEFVDGKPLGEHIGGRALPVADAVGLAVQTTDALAAAHQAGIVHRDVKPANLMVTEGGRVKVLDFGLAKLVERGETDESATTMTADVHTEEGVVLGTASYMSPEQAQGKAIDARSDVFSLGVVLYEMLTGRRPFQGDSHVSTRLAILQDEPPPLKAVDKDIPVDLERIVLRCLAKQKELRYASAFELREDLRRFQARLESSSVGWSSLLRQPRIVVPASLVLLAVIALGTWLWKKQSRLQWARLVALPEIERLVQEESLVEAYFLAQEVENLIPDDPKLQRLQSQLTIKFNLETDPPGADVYWKDYADIDGPWVPAGETPLEDASVPAAYLRWRLTEDGFEPLETGFYAYSVPPISLTPKGQEPADMVKVTGGNVRLGDDDPVALEDYWLDKYEVTNRQFKTFVDAGGYQKPEYWKHPFIKDGREIPWEEAMSEFVDTTGRPGPSTWELGAFPEGEDDFPVSGVSWYEAAAFAEFAGKSLPTVYHWIHATDVFSPPIVIELSNFDGQGPAPVGSYHGVGPYGTYDMAGNVKEWCWNRAGERRYIIGGNWMEPAYMYRARHAQLPFDRSPSHGFRCARYDSSPPAPSTMPIERSFWRDYSKEQPVADDVFRAYERIYAYDKTDLEAESEPVDAGSSYWTKERVTFNAAYANDRVIAYLFLPVNAAPPYQTVVYFPGSGAEFLPSHENVMMQYLDFIIRSGRAMLYPIYIGTYERRFHEQPQGNARRDQLIQWFKDLARSVDYLETRDDIDQDRLAYYGLSLGASRGPIFMALEKRFKTGIFLSGGLDRSTPPPEIDPFNFITRVTMPILMINGRDDYRFPLETSQKPFFHYLGTPDAEKRHALIDGGHIPSRMAVIREVLDWLDEYLGPVAPPGTS